MGSSAVPIPEEKKAAVSSIERRAVAVCDDALARQIRTQGEAVAVMLLRDEVINPLIKEGDALFDPMIAAAYQTHQIAIATKRKAVGGLPAAKSHVANLLGRWAQVCEDRARAERLRVEQVAREEEAARLAAEIKAVEDAGGPDMVEEAVAIMEAPRPALVLPPVAVPVAVPGARDVYTAEVVNLRQFYASIGDGQTPASLADPNQGALNRRAAADKEGFNVPGCRLLKSKSVSSRRSV